MKILERSNATTNLGDMAAKVAREPIVVTENGKPLAALVSLKNADLETVSLSTNPEFIALITQIRARQQKEGGLSPDQVRRRLGLPQAKPSENRARARPTKQTRNGGD